MRIFFGFDGAFRGCSGCGRASGGCSGGDGFGFFGFEFTAGDFGVPFRFGHGEGDAALFEIDAHDLGVDLVAVLDDFAGAVDAFHRELADVDEAFDAGGEFNESAEFDDFLDGAGDGGADAELRCDIFPRVADESFEREGDTFFVDIKAGDHDLELVAFLDDGFGIGDALVAHGGDVEQAIDAAEIDECPVSLHAANGAFAHLSDRKFLPGLDGFLFFLFFEDGAA